MNKSTGPFYGGITETLLVSTVLILVTVVVVRDHAGILPLFLLLALAVAAFRKAPRIGVASSPTSLIVLLALFAGPILIAILAAVSSPWTLSAAIVVTIAYIVLFVARRFVPR